jgi:hypothetical protein
MWLNLSASRGIIAALIPRRACEKEILQSLLVLQGFFPPARKDTRGYLIGMSFDARRHFSPHATKMLSLTPIQAILYDLDSEKRIGATAASLKWSFK